MNRLNFMVAYSRRANPFDAHELIQNAFNLKTCKHYERKLSIIKEKLGYFLIIQNWGKVYSICYLYI